MRYVLSLALVLSLLAGCEKKNEVKTTEVPPDRTMEELAPPTPTDNGGSTIDDSTPTRLTPVERTYTIQKGDTLWSIARTQLGDGKRYKEIMELNPGLEPNKLRIGTVIKLPE